MANRDLFAGGQEHQGYRGGGRRMAGGRLMRRLVGQSVAALVIFGAVIGLYEHESALGEGVRYVVALASADQQEIMAVGNFSDFIGNLGIDVDVLDNMMGVNGDEVENGGTGDKIDAAGDGALSGEADGENIGDDTGVSGDAYMAAAALDSEAEPVMILPVSGLMEGAFGDIGEDGLSIAGLKIYCQGEQQVKAAAVGRVTEVLDGQTILIEHSGGIESRYSGEVQPEVAVGDSVRQGQLIGSVEEGEMLFQVLREGEAMDPFLFLQGPE